MTSGCRATWQSQLDYGQSSEQPTERPAWYYEGLEDLEDNTRRFFVEYAKLDSDKVVPHIELLVWPLSGNQ